MREKPAGERWRRLQAFSSTGENTRETAINRGSLQLQSELPPSSTSTDPSEIVYFA
jgi:hypothetical protein